MRSPLDLYCACQPGRRCQRGVQYLNCTWSSITVFLSPARPTRPDMAWDSHLRAFLSGHLARSISALGWWFSFGAWWLLPVLGGFLLWLWLVFVVWCSGMLWGPSGLRPALGCLRSFWRLFVFWRSGACAHRGVFLFFFLAIRLACVLLPLRAASAHGWFTCQIDCRTRCQIECQIECQNIRQIRCEKECQNDEYVISR